MACLASLVLGARAASAHPDVHEEISTLDARIARPDASAADLMRRGELHRLAGEWTLAAADYDRAAALDPSSIGPALGRAALALDAGRPWEAEASLDQLLVTHDGEPRALGLRAEARSAQGRWRDAADDLARLDRVAPLNPDQILRRAEWLDRAGSPDAALQALDAGVARLGEVPGLELTAAELEARLGANDAARQRRARFDASLRDIAAGLAPLPGTPRRAAGEAPVRPLIGTPETPGNGDGLPPTHVTRGPYLQSVSKTGAVIRWRTNIPLDTRVRYGASGKPDHFVGDTTRTLEHVVKLTGLAPGTAYRYAIGSWDPTEDFEWLTSFRTAPPAGVVATTRVWAIGDSGDANFGAAAVRDAFARWTGAREPDVWLMLGDNAYPSGTDAQYQAGVFDMYHDLLSRVSLFPTRGNHDFVYGGTDDDYYDFFTLPTAGECGGVPSGTEAYYAFDSGDVHFVCLDSEGSDRSRGGAMLRWLQSDLAANTHPWVIAFWHHPPYSKGSHDSDNASDSDGKMRDMRQNALGILDSAGVDLVLSGHSHSYERSFLLRSHYGYSWTLTSAMKVDSTAGRPNGGGPYHKPSPTHGPLQGTVYTVAGDGSETEPGPLNHPVMISSQLVLGSLVIDVTGVRLDARFLDATGVVRDSFAIVKGAGTAGAPPTKQFLEGSSLALDAVDPDPLTSAGVIRYTLPRAGRATLRVLDAAGRAMGVLADGVAAAGPHEARWEGRDGTRPVAPGVYFAVLTAGGEQRTRRFVVIR